MERYKMRLPVPAAVKRDRNAKELLHMWRAGGADHMSIDPLLWEDPAVWGTVLVDLARNIAFAYEEAGMMRAPMALGRMRMGFDAEWNSPTDGPPRGGLIGDDPRD